MRDTGVPPHPGDYLTSLPRTGAGVRDDPTPPHAPAYSSLEGLSNYREHLERTFADGTTPNGVFGAKLMWNQLPELQALAGGLPQYAGLAYAPLLRKLFRDPVFVWVSRRDKVRQAVSMWRALQSRRWRGSADADSAGPPREPVYRFEGIDHLVGLFTEHDRAWEEFFTAHSIDPVAIAYEDDLERDRQGVVEAVLDRLGVAPPPGWHAPEPMARQADARSEEWVAAYRHDLAAARF